MISVCCRCQQAYERASTEVTQALCKYHQRSWPGTVEDLTGKFTEKQCWTRLTLFPSCSKRFSHCTNTGSRSKIRHLQPGRDVLPPKLSGDLYAFYRGVIAETPNPHYAALTFPETLSFLRKPLENILDEFSSGKKNQMWSIIFHCCWIAWIRI